MVHKLMGQYIFESRYALVNALVIKMYEAGEKLYAVCAAIGEF
jgi:hypothetical protein